VTLGRVIVLGGSGMLGAMVVDVLSRDKDLALTATVRDARVIPPEFPKGIVWKTFAWTADDDLRVVDGHQWVINCIGVTKPLIRDTNALEVERAVRVNALFPYVLAARAADAGARILQIATDCVYSGAQGGYRENDPHDALDVYGKSKSLGEVPREHVHNLRCSIIGPEPKDYKFLLEWFRRQPRGAQVNGFTNHRWNGVTTLHFARLCLGIIKGASRPSTLQHVVPSDLMTKADMLRAFGAAYGRTDVTVTDVQAAVAVDRTLATMDPAANRTLWQQAGYDQPPSVGQMIDEMSRFSHRFGAPTIPS
jgi:dTDP-4-dehydrorhamnose reductase